MPAGPMRELFKTLAGFNGLTLIQAEDDSILKMNHSMLKASGRKNPGITIIRKNPKCLPVSS